MSEETPVSVTLEKDGNVAVIIVNNPPVNALSWHVRQGLEDSFGAALADDSVEAIVLRCAGGTFIAGADISEFGKPPRGPDFNAVLNSIEAASKPVVAAIHGTALGGGLETALVCHYRIAVPSAKLGVPEVKLGLLLRLVPLCKRLNHAVCQRVKVLGIAGGDARLHVVDAFGQVKALGGGEVVLFRLVKDFLQIR